MLWGFLVFFVAAAIGAGVLRGIWKMAEKDGQQDNPGVWILLATVALGFLVLAVGGCVAVASP